MIDAAHFVFARECIPSRAFVGIDNRAELDAGFNPRQRSAFRLENHWKAVAVALANDDDRLAFAVLICGLAAINPVLFEIGRANEAAEIGPVRFRNLVLTADLPALELFGMLAQTPQGGRRGIPT